MSQIRSFASVILFFFNNQYVIKKHCIVGLSLRMRVALYLRYGEMNRNIYIDTLFTKRHFLPFNSVYMVTPPVRNEDCRINTYAKYFLIKQEHIFLKKMSYLCLILPIECAKITKINQESL